MQDDDFKFEGIEKLPNPKYLWPIAALIILVIFFVNTLRIQNISAEQVGLLLNKFTGKISTIQKAGVVFYIGITHNFFVLDKKIQILAMTEDPGFGEVLAKDDIKIKTIDGSDVYVDIVVQFRIDPDMAETVLTTSGPGNAYKHKWARDYVRTIVRDYLGELTTEQFYESQKRNEKILMAEKECNERLNGFGIRIDRITTPKKPHFYKEYEEMIKKKTVAEQVVLEEQSKAQAAKQKQQTLIVEVTNKKNVSVEQFRGSMQKKIIEAQASAEKAKQNADAYFDKITIGAEAFLYQMQKEAEAILARKKALATGIEALKKALEGEGGKNMVKMEYAKRLKDVVISGKPFTVDSHTERFEHLSDAAAAEAKAPKQSHAAEAKKEAK